MSPLLPKHRALLKASAITPSVAEARGYRSAIHRGELEALDFQPNQIRLPALVVPIHDVFGEIALHQIRPDEPRQNGKGKPIKYETPGGAHMVIDVPPITRPGLGDPTVELWITEGARKADAAVSRGLYCIGLLGVWNWRGTNSSGGATALADWEQIALKDRSVFIAFDSDVMTKPEVAHALSRLRTFLARRGARVKLVYLPEGAGGEKVGLDDFLAAGHGADDLLALATKELRLPTAPSAELTDTGNADRLVERYGDDLRYVRPWRRWLVWDGNRWASDQHGEIVLRAKDTARHIHEEAALTEDLSQQKRISDWAKRSQSERQLRAMASLAQPELSIAPEELDTDPWLLCVQNGVVNLRTGKLREPRRSDYITKCAGVKFDGSARSDRWEAFLERVLPDAKLRAYVQRAVGYALTALTLEQVLFLLWGMGANGKTTFLETLLALLGDYGQKAPPELLLARRSDGVPNDVARLRGARFVSAVETDEGRRLAESRAKQLTGGDTVGDRQKVENSGRFAGVTGMG